MGTHDESAANRGAAASVFESESWQEAQVASNGAEAENKGDNIDECATKRVPGRIKKPHGFVYFVATDNERFGNYIHYCPDFAFFLAFRARFR